MDSIEQLQNVVRSKDGIEAVIRSLEGKLSEAIMHAMQNGPDLEQRVSHILKDIESQVSRSGPD